MQEFFQGNIQHLRKITNISQIWKILKTYKISNLSINRLESKVFKNISTYAPSHIYAHIVILPEILFNQCFNYNVGQYCSLLAIPSEQRLNKYK